MDTSGARDRLEAAERETSLASATSDLAIARHAISQLKKDKASLASLAADLGAALEVHRDLSENHPVTAAPPPDERSGNPPTADSIIVPWTDWHLPEIVRAEEVGGRNETNPEIGRQRAHSLVGTQIELLHQHMRDRAVSEHVVPILGDFLVNREMHEDSTLCVDMTPLQEMRFCRDVLIECIDRLVAESDVPRIVFPMVWGNHGRSTPKPRHARSWAQSFEFEMYAQLIRHYKSEEEAGRVESGRLTFLLDETPRKVYETAGVRFVFEHGDRTGFKYPGGVGGILVPFRRRAMEITREEGAQFLVIGHWHQGVHCDVGAICPSLVGINSYGYGRFVDEPPGALMFVASAKYRRVAAIRRIWVG